MTSIGRRNLLACEAQDIRGRPPTVAMIALKEKYQKFIQANWAQRRFLIREATTRRLVRPLAVFVGLPLLMVFRILNPLLSIRIGILISERVGHLVVNTEWWLRSQALQNGRRREVSLFLSDRPANTQVLTMIKRKLRVWDSPLQVAVFRRLRRYWPNHPAWINLVNHFNFSCDSYEKWGRVSPQLSFTSEEWQRGEDILRSIGIEIGEPFTCFLARDPAYLDTLHTYRSRDGWSYHDYRDCDINSYLPAAEFLAARGIWALRMGKVVAKQIQSSHPRVFDYAANLRSDFADVYLMANCKFFLGDTAGIFILSAAFGVPCALANIVPLGLATYSPRDLFIFKKYKHLESERFLKVSEIIALGADLWLQTEKYVAAGIGVIENTADEVFALTQEMNARLDGTWVPQDGDEELQDRYQALFPRGHVFRGCPSRVGAEFLRQNQDLLA